MTRPRHTSINDVQPIVEGAMRLPVPRQGSQQRGGAGQADGWVGLRTYIVSTQTSSWVQDVNNSWLLATRHSDVRT